MIGPMIVLAAALVAQGPPTPGATSKAEPPAGVTVPEANALAEYNGLRDKTPQTAAAQWKLALWCESHGLQPEAYVHFGRVVELDPTRDLAWRKLGFKKHDGHWATEAQIAEETVQKQADKEWTIKLKRLHKEVHPAAGKGKAGEPPAEAHAALDAITDPGAVGSIYREFAGGGRKDQEMAVRLLGQIESPVASKGLALLAVYGKHPDVRRVATEILRGRPSSEFLDLLIAMMQDPIRHQVRPVGGPGSPGALFIEGDQFNVQRIYAPPPAPGFDLRPGDLVTYDQFGMPVISRTSSIYLGNSSTAVKGSPGLFNKTNVWISETDTFSYSAAITEAQKGAFAAQSQLAADIKRLEAVNEQRKVVNDRVQAVARASTGKDPGPTTKEWKKLLPDARRYDGQPGTKQTIAAMVPLDYVPDLAAIMRIKRDTVTFSHLTRDT